MKSRRCSSRCGGFTLIEVLAGLAILGSLLVGLVLARRSLIDQQLRADRKLVAIDLADALLTSWAAQSVGTATWLASIPRDDQGDIHEALTEDDIGDDGQAGWRWRGTPVPAPGQWMWRTREVAAPAGWTLDDAGIVRLEVFDGPLSSRSEPVVVVELLAPAEGDRTGQGGSHP